MENDCYICATVLLLYSSWNVIPARFSLTEDEILKKSSHSYLINESINQGEMSDGYVAKFPAVAFFPTMITSPKDKSHNASGGRMYEWLYFFIQLFMYFNSPRKVLGTQLIIWTTSSLHCICFHFLDSSYFRRIKSSDRCHWMQIVGEIMYVWEIKLTATANSNTLDISVSSLLSA